MTSPSAGTVIYWDGRLSALLATLTAELDGTESGTWARRTVTGGFLVALSINEGKRVLRISHATRPAGGRWGDSYREDVERIQQHLGVAHWDEKMDQAVKAGAASWREDPGGRA